MKTHFLYVVNSKYFFLTKARVSIIKKKNIFFMQIRLNGGKGQRTFILLPSQRSFVKNSFERRYKFLAVAVERLLKVGLIF